MNVVLRDTLLLFGIANFLIWLNTTTAGAIDHLTTMFNYFDGYADSKLFLQCFFWWRRKNQHRMTKPTPFWFYIFFGGIDKPTRQYKPLERRAWRIDTHRRLFVFKII